MVGDALGAAVEGWERQEIRRLAQKTWGTDTVEDFIAAVPMGTFVSGAEPATYRPARGVNDTAFVPSGPTSNPGVAKHCARFGMYTDDTNASLAIAYSITKCKRIDSAHCGRTCAEFFRDNEHYRGCPPTAKRIMKATLDGVSADETGLPPWFPFPGGSFANGGAMRISPLGIACRSALWGEAELRSAVVDAIRSSHRHPEAIDFAVVQARAVQYCMSVEPHTFDAQGLLADLASRCETEDMKNVIVQTALALKDFRSDQDDLEVVARIVDGIRRPGSGMGFQIASVHMAPCVLWAACLHHRDPVSAVKLAIDLGGDTDTTASMVGAIMGALHGDEWCSPWVGKLENGAHGVDFALKLGEELVALDLSPSCN
eukprot:TRINITY_DN73368_c0_g1_i1.p1 TRINITY_DN73368_c0_g1~~TRINITY_DN73368_c0_g1_i1.p1  ORF type:complete len:415 (-),score=43.28 TRINITY_DN73368_c0_g1_i1:106-1221(-)